MKNYPTGFKPANFKAGSIVFLIIGIVSIFLSIITVANKSISIPTLLFYFGVIAVILSLYFAYIARKKA